MYLPTQKMLCIIILAVCDVIICAIDIIDTHNKKLATYNNSVCVCERERIICA